MQAVFYLAVPASLCHAAHGPGEGSCRKKPWEAAVLL